MLTPEKIAEMDRITGRTTPTNPTTSIAKTRAEEIRALGRSNEVPITGLVPILRDVVAPKLAQGEVNTAKALLDRGKRFSDDVMEAGKQDANKPLAEKAVGLARQVGKIPGQIAGGVGDIISNMLAPFVPQEVKDKTGTFFTDIATKFNTRPDDIADPEGAKQYDKVHKVFSTISQKVKENPDLASSVFDLINVATLGGGSAAENTLKPIVKEGFEKTLSGASDLVEKGVSIAKPVIQKVENIFTPSQKNLDSYVTKKFEKAVKPTIVGKGTLAKVDAYKQDVLGAVKTIKANEKNLVYNTENGVESARLPRSLQEFAEANDKTKETIFNQYNALAKQANKAGASVDTLPIVHELDDVVRNKALQISSPETVKYAESLQQRFRDIGKIDTETTQQVIKNYNNSLQAFYRNPTYDSASKVAIDAGVANSFRRQLDSVIENATGKEYQALKNQYGQLKAIENDINKAALRDARKNVKGLLDYSDIFTGGQMIGGILSLNPAMFAKGAVERGFKEWFKYLNNPNKAIQKMFEKAI